MVQINRTMSKGNIGDCDNTIQSLWNILDYVKVCFFSQQNPAIVKQQNIAAECFSLYIHGWSNHVTPSCNYLDDAKERIKKINQLSGTLESFFFI